MLADLLTQQIFAEFLYISGSARPWDTERSRTPNGSRSTGGQTCKGQQQAVSGSPRLAPQPVVLLTPCVCVGGTDEERRKGCPDAPASWCFVP